MDNQCCKPEKDVEEVEVEEDVEEGEKKQL